MTRGKVIFYDYDHCGEFLKGHAEDLRTSAKGMAAFGLYRSLFQVFAHEAMDTEAITLGQFDAGLIFLFVPGTLSRSLYPHGHKVARAKATEMLGSTESPMAFELVAAQSMDPPLPDAARFQKWMPADLTALLEHGDLSIHMIINGHAFYEQILVPSLLQNGFTPADDYRTGAKAGFVRVRHPDAPGKVFKLPWIRWIREMFAGGYSMAFLMACFGTYLGKMAEAIPASAPSTTPTTS